MGEVRNETILDRRKERAWWHEEARELASQGMPYGEIANRFNRSYFAVRAAVKEKRSADRHRGAANGIASGRKFKRVSISFTDEQIAAINERAERIGKSFSFAAASLIDEALSSTREQSQ